MTFSLDTGTIKSSIQKQKGIMLPESMDKFNQQKVYSNESN